MRFLVVLVGLSIVGLLMLGCSGASPELQSEASSVASGGEPRTGQEIFASTCAACHGETGEGTKNWMQRDEDGRLPPPPLNGDGHTWHHGDGLLFRVVSEGGLGIGFGSNMPAFKDELSWDEIIAVIEYVKTLWEGKEIDGIRILDSQRELSAVDPYPSEGG